MSHPDSDPPSDPDTQKFDLIQIRRWVDGKMKVSPKNFRGCELRSWDQVIEVSGGSCFYQCVAQDGTTHRFSALSEKVHFASLPRKSSRRKRRAR